MRTVVAEQVRCGGRVYGDVYYWVLISYESKSSVDKGIAIAENKFSVRRGWEDVRLCIGGQDQDCVVFDEITGGGPG